MKRFTDTEKWADRWFSALSLTHKAVWHYVCDRCDAAGVWEPNFKLAAFQIGARINWEEVLQAFDGKVRLLRNGGWWIPSFIVFQYGDELKPTANVHQSCINLLKKHGLWEDYQQWLEQREDRKSQQAENDTIPIPLSWDKVKVEVKVKAGMEGGAGEGKGPTAADIYAAYPRKVAKQDALKAIARALERIGKEHGHHEEFRPADWLLNRVQGYAAIVASWPKDAHRYIPFPATWFNRGSYDDDPETWRRDDSGKGRASFA